MKNTLAFNGLSQLWWSLLRHLCIKNRSRENKAPWKMAPSATIILFSVQYTCSSGNGVARLPGRNSGQKAQKGPQKKNFWPNFGWFYQKQAEKGPQKIFKRCSLFLAVITVINLIFNIQYTNFLRPLFCLFLVKISQNSARNFFLWPLLSFLAGISAW